MINTTAIKDILSLESDNVKRFLIIFYIVGFTGFIIPLTNPYFIYLTKWALVLNFMLLTLFHEDTLNTRCVLTFLLIFILGYLIEAIGVNYGFIFGDYTYGKGLGVKIWNTPLLIGINWLMLSYCFRSIFSYIQLNAILKIIAAALGMLLFDIIMEQSASMLDMWYWNNINIPLRNYLSWFLVAIIFQIIIEITKIKIVNPLAKTIIACQFVFFSALGIYKYLIQ